MTLPQPICSNISPTRAVVRDVLIYELRNACASTRRLSALALPATAALALLLTACQSVPGGQASFQRLVIHERVAANGHVLLADLGGDSGTDIVLMSPQPGRLSWFRNPDWEMQSIPFVADVLHSAAAYAPPAPAAASRPPASLALNGRFSHPGSGTFQQMIWLQNPGRERSQQTWAGSLIRDDAQPGQLLWADMTGTGRQILIALPTLEAYTLPRQAALTSGRAWGRMALVPDPSRGPQQIIRARVHDWDLDGRDDLLLAGGEGLDLMALASRGRFVDEFGLITREGAGGSGAGFLDVGVGQSGRPARRFIAVLSDNGDSLLVFRPGGPGNRDWRAQILSESLNAARVLKVADLNRDDSDEIIVGSNDGLSVYYYDAELDHWGQYALEADVAIADIEIDDLNGNGFPDIVTAPAGPGPVLLFQNSGRAN